MLCPKIYRAMNKIGFSDPYSMLCGTVHRDCTQNVSSLFLHLIANYGTLEIYLAGGNM